MRDERLFVLLDAYLDGALSPEEKAELEQMLLESAAARQEFWNRASLHGWTYEAAKLHFAAQSIQVRIPAVAVAEEPTEEPAAKKEPLRLSLAFVPRCPHCGKVTVFGARHHSHGDGAPNLVEFLKTEPARWVVRLREKARWFETKWAMAGAMAVVGVALLIVWDQTGRDANTDETDSAAATTTAKSVAVLAHSAGVQWDGPVEGLGPGDTLAPGWLRLKAGAAMIQFNNGTRAIVEGPAEFEIRSQGDTFLRSGKLNVRVPKKARGFKVQSSVFTLVDLGTEFGLNVPPKGAPEVHVFTGVVELAYTNGTQLKQRLTQGHAVRITGNGAPEISASRAAFLTETELEKREQPELRARYADWKQASHEFDNDPALLLHFDFDGQKPSDRALINRARSPQPGVTTEIIGCDWVEGRWPGKGALAFQHPNDRVRLTLPGEYQSLTYLAWIYVDSLTNRLNALALTQRIKLGEVHWQLDNRGSISMTVNYRDKTNSGWEGISSKPVITKERIGHWFHLAAVYDAPENTMSLYINGQLAATKIIEHPMTLTLGAFELGNWTLRGDLPDREKWMKGRPASYVNRNLQGRMDEFALLSRPLSAKEIRNHYEQGWLRNSTAIALQH